MQKYIHVKFYNKALKGISLEEIKDYGLKPMGGGYVWWLAPVLSAAMSGASMGVQSNNQPSQMPQVPKFKQAENFQMPENVYGQPTGGGEKGLSSNLMGDYNSKPSYGPQDNANPWQEQLMSQLFQQQTDAPRQKEGGGGSK